MFDVLGRLDRGASPVQAREGMKALAAARRAEDTESSRAGLEYDALPLQDAVVAPVRQQLLLLLGRSSSCCWSAAAR
jgi:hypothetical protein